MARGIGVDLVSFGGGEVIGSLQQARAECDRLRVRFGGVINV